MLQVVLIHNAHTTRSPMQVSVGRFSALPPARTLAVKWQMGSNTGPKAHKERGFFLGFLLDFSPTMVGRSVSSHTLPLKVMTQCFICQDKQSAKVHETDTTTMTSD